MVDNQLRRGESVKTQQIRHHWSYFINLEKDFEKLTHYIEPSKRNFSVYSFELNKIILLACSEFEVLSKEFCESLENGKDHDFARIDDLRSILSRKYPNIADVQIRLPRTDLVVRPLLAWREDHQPEWWRDHNAVKHDRFDYYHLSNLKNAIESLAALMVINLYVHRQFGVAIEVFPQVLDAAYLPEEMLVKGKASLPDFK